MGNKSKKINGKISANTYYTIFSWERMTITKDKDLIIKWYQLPPTTKNCTAHFWGDGVKDNEIHRKFTTRNKDVNE